MAAGGAALLVAGCGPTKEATYTRAQVLDQQRRTLAKVKAALDGLPAGDRARVKDLVTRTNARLEQVGGSPGPAARATSLADVLAAEQAALRTHVTGVGETGDQPTRALLATLIADTAQDTATLQQLLGQDTLVHPFPGETTR